MGNSENLICSVVCLNEQKIQNIRTQLKSQSHFNPQADMLKVLGHPVRLEILAVLHLEESCVCDLANILEKPVSTISQHLKNMRNVGILQSRQSGKLVFYKPNDSPEIWKLIHPFITTFKENSIC